MTQNYRSYSGCGNNLDNPGWGAANGELLREPTKAKYADGKSQPVSGRPNPREISNNVCIPEDPPRPPHDSLTNYMWAWGQFLDHEIDLTPADTGDDSLTFQTPANDPDSPDATVKFSRSRFAHGTGETNARQQVNILSSYIDASNVYGADCERALALRTLDGTGKLKSQLTPHGPLLPFNSVGVENDQGPLRAKNRPDKFFAAGDLRANEHNVLTCMHTLFMREHNRLCDQLAERKSSSLKREITVLGEDEAIYQRARRIVGAIEQVITYEEFLPKLLGSGAIPSYRSYKPSVNASIANVFSTACYRLGHSMLNEKLLLVGYGGDQVIKKLRLRDAFWKPERIIEIGIDDFLNGLWQQNMEQMDTQAVAAIRSTLFNVHPRGKPKPMLLDLAALNIQRGRDHGLPDYNTCRANYGLKRKREFSDVSSDAETVRRLKNAYKNKIDRIDPWVGGLAEDPHKKSILGEFFFTVIRDQFIRLRDGDRFWYENDPVFSDREKADLKKTKLSDVIKRNTKSATLPDDVFNRK
jgi:peroxidase